MPKAALPSGLRLHYQQLGQGEDVVMIHGLTGNLAVWHFQIVPLLVDQFRITTYDLRGHGHSETPPAHYTPDDMAHDLAALLDVLEIERPALVGHSFGGDVALYFAHHYPERVRQVVAIEPALPATLHLRRSEEWTGWDTWVRKLEEAGVSVPLEHRNDWPYLMRLSFQLDKPWGPLKGRPLNPKVLDRLTGQTSALRDSQEVGTLTLDRLGELRVPVTLIYTENSTFRSTHTFLEEHLPNVRSVLLPASDLGHFGPLQQPEVVAAEIRAALGDPYPNGARPLSHGERGDERKNTR